MSAPLPIPGFSDPVSSLSHLAGALTFALLSIPLLRRARGNSASIFSLAIFCLSAVFLLTMSGIYHLLDQEGSARMVFKRLDHSAIFVLIVGTMTPIHAIPFRGFMRWGWLALIWLLAITALTLKAIFFETFPEWLGLTLYLTLGWAGIVTGGLIIRRFHLTFASPILYGGIAYTLGAVLEFLQWPAPLPGVVGPHELFHLAVLAGLGFHWWFIHRIAHPTTLPA